VVAIDAGLKIGTSGTIDARAGRWIDRGGVVRRRSRTHRTVVIDAAAAAVAAAVAAGNCCEEGGRRYADGFVVGRRFASGH